MKAVLQRSNNRNDALLDAAAAQFAAQGFRETTMRDIAKSVGMLPGSIYYHFGSKDDLLLSVYEAGVERMVAEFNAALAGAAEPWERLTAAIAAHISAITRKSPYMQVINRVLPEHVPKHADSLRRLRERYEACFSELIAELPIAASIDRSLLRLMILGAANHAQFWFDPESSRSPEEIGKAFARFLIEPIGGDRVPSSRMNPSRRQEGDRHER